MDWIEQEKRADPIEVGVIQQIRRLRTKLNIHSFADLSANLQNKVDGASVVYAQFDVGLRTSVESRRLCGHVVMPHSEKWNHILAAAGRSEATDRNSLVCAHHRDCCVRYHRSAWVGDPARNRGCDFLARSVATAKEEEST